MLQIGSEVEFSSDMRVVTEISNTKLTVKKGDRAIVTREGFKMINGEAKGKIISFNSGDELSGYDTKNISKLIYSAIHNICFEDYTDYEDTKVLKERKNSILEKIECILDTLL